MFQPLQANSGGVRLARAALEALEVRGKPFHSLRATKPVLPDSNRRRIEITSDAVVTGNLGAAHDLLASLGVFVDAGDHGGDPLPQVSLAGDEAAAAESESIPGASMVSLRVTTKHHAMRAILRGTSLLTGQAWNMNTSAGYPFAPARRQCDVGCLALGDGTPMDIVKDHIVLPVAAPTISYNSANVQVAREEWLHELERHRCTTSEEALRKGCFGTLRDLLNDIARAYAHDKPGDNPLQVDRYSNCSRETSGQIFLHPTGVPERAMCPAKDDTLPLVRCDGTFACPNLQQRGPVAHVPTYGAVSVRGGSFAGERTKLIRTVVERTLRGPVTKSLVLNELRAVQKLVNAVYLDDGAAIRKQFTDSAPIAIGRLGCLRLLHKAAEVSSRRAIAALLEVGCDASDLDSSGVSPLHIAAARGFGDITRVLLNANANFHAVDANGDTALIKAARGEHTNVVKSLLKAGANPTGRSKSGDTPLHLAARNGDCRTMAILTQFGGIDVNAVNNGQESALYTAVKNGDTDSITILLNEGASITAGFCSHGSAVHLAAHLGLHNCLDVIVNHDSGRGRSIDLEGEDMPRRLLRAVQCQDANAVMMLLAHRACVSKRYLDDNTLLHIASDAKSVEWLTKFGARGNCRNRWSCTPLHYAVIDGKRDVLKALLKADVSVDIDVKTDEGMTALHYAVLRGDTCAIKTLLKHGADTRARNKRGATALHLAVALDLLDVVKALLWHGVHATRAVDKSEPPPPKKTSGGKSNAKLMPSPRERRARDPRKRNIEGAAELEDLRSAEHEAKVSAPCSNCVNSSNDLGESPLHIAASIGNIEVAQALLACGARPQSIDNKGATPLHIAVLYAHHGVVLALLAGGANVGRADDEGKTALHIACDFGGVLSLATIDSLLAHGAPTACGENNGCTPLHVAILSLDCNTVISAEATRQRSSSSISDVGSMDESTLLCASVDRSGEEVVEFLLDHGAPVGAKNHQGKSPLRLACEEGHLGIARILLRAGASPGVRGEEGLTPLHTACSRGHVEIVKLLLSAGALPGHCYNWRGVSPLHVAAQWGRLDAVKALLPRLTRRKVDMRCKLGATPLIAAVKRRDKDMVAAVSPASQSWNYSLWF